MLATANHSLGVVPTTIPYDQRNSERVRCVAFRTDSIKKTELISILIANLSLDAEAGISAASSSVEKTKRSIYILNPSPRVLCSIYSNPQT